MPAADSVFIWWLAGSLVLPLREPLEDAAALAAAAVAIARGQAGDRVAAIIQLSAPHHRLFGRQVLHHGAQPAAVETDGEHPGVAVELEADHVARDGRAAVAVAGRAHPGAALAAVAQLAGEG